MHSKDLALRILQRPCRNVISDSGAWRKWRKHIEPLCVPSFEGVTGAFLATGIISAFAGIVLQSQLHDGQSSVGREYLLPAFTVGTSVALHV
jgi:hypothetical protein